LIWSNPKWWMMQKSHQNWYCVVVRPPWHYPLALCLWGMPHDLTLTCPWACTIFIVTMECNPRHVPNIWGLEVHVGTPRWNYDKGVNTSSFVNKVKLHQSNHKLISISCNLMVLKLNLKQLKFISFTWPKIFKTFWNFNSQNDP
jgi:hypothetical protein